MGHGHQAVHNFRESVEWRNYRFVICLFHWRSGHLISKFSMNERPFNASLAPLRLEINDEIVISSAVCGNTQSFLQCGHSWGIRESLARGKDDLT